MLDPLSILIAIACSAFALTATLFVGWLGSRRDTYLLSWSAGVALVVLGVAAFSGVRDIFDPALHFLSFALIIVGFLFIYAGAHLFRRGTLPGLPVAVATAGFVGAVGACYLFGLAGLGTILANLGMAALMTLSGYQYWAGRREAAGPMLINAALYLLTALSFLLCALVLVVEGRLTLDALPRNWAEDINSIVAIISLTGIGALSLMLNQQRWARHHHREARTDALTELLNRRALFGKLSAAHLPPGATVIMFDLDHFKSINDKFGHAGGDLVLEAFADILRRDRHPTDIAARLGGEEFCLVLIDPQRRSGVAVAEAIRVALGIASIPANGGEAGATVSAGVAVAGIDGEAFEEVLRRADDALYLAKNEGRNRVIGPSPRLVA